MNDYSGIVASEIFIILVLLVLTTDRGRKFWYTLLGQTQVRRSVGGQSSREESILPGPPGSPSATSVD